MKRLIATLTLGVIAILAAGEARAQGWTYGYTPVGGYTYAAPNVYPSYSYYTTSYAYVAPRPMYTYYAPAGVRPWPTYSYWVNAGYPFRTYSYYANFSGAFPTYGYIYGYPYYAAGYRAYVW